MRSTLIVATMLGLIGCGGSQGSSGAPPSDDTTDRGTGGETAEANEFQIRESDTAEDARGVRPSQIESTETEAAIRFFVIDRDEGPIEGIVIKLTAPDGSRYYTDETDAEGFAEVLVPVDAKYELTYLSLGRRDVTAHVNVPPGPNQDLKLTLRYRRHDPPAPRPGAPTTGPRFVLKGIRFDTGKATLRGESYERLDEVVEYLTHKKSARIEVSGHTDDVGSPAANKALSKKRAEAVREHLISQGIEGGRIEAVGYGAEQPVASNDTEEGRQKNRRIEVTELR
ncbi:MAG: OmpA family protein [Myxococcota bacterium]